MDYSNGNEFEISYFRTIWSAIASIGWYLIAIGISFWLASPYIREKYLNWKLRRDELEYAAKYRKNPDLLQARLLGLEASRQRMQEEYYQKCAMLTEEKGKEQKENIKETSKLTLDNNILDFRLRKKNNDLPPFTEKKHKSLREEYNPLMGDGSRGYRPPKRTCCGKGGCGTADCIRS
ncbi:uncharacterized protein LOC102672681 [Apis dorsata]|uniref:uncharacterized protein LOC102672681 n=1 Tax=Apis dorsata TaxID=7462 RepID=UPI0003DF6A9A|nr:uncharacterized protein LOC102672681 [Apis dorsata]